MHTSEPACAVGTAFCRLFLVVAAVAIFPLFVFASLLALGLSLPPFTPRGSLSSSRDTPLATLTGFERVFARLTEPAVSVVSTVRDLCGFSVTSPPPLSGSRGLACNAARVVRAEPRVLFGGITDQSTARSVTYKNRAGSVLIHAASRVSRVSVKVA